MINSVLLSFEESRCACLFSGYLVDQTRRVGQGKIHHILVEPSMELKQTELIQAIQKNVNYWSLLHFYILLSKRAFLQSSV